MQLYDTAEFRREIYRAIKRSYNGQDLYYKVKDMYLDDQNTIMIIHVEVPDQMNEVSGRIIAESTLLIEKNLNNEHCYVYHM